MLSAGCPAPAGPPLSAPSTPGRPGCSWTACSSSAASADCQAHGSWARRQQESAGTHALGRRTPPGRSHFLLADCSSASAHVCFGLKASVYNLSPGRTGTPQKGFTEAGQCLLFSCFSLCEGSAKTWEVTGWTLKPRGPNSRPAIIFSYHPCDLGQMT